MAQVIYNYILYKSASKTVLGALKVLLHIATEHAFFLGFLYNRRVSSGFEKLGFCCKSQWDTHHFVPEEVKRKCFVAYRSSPLTFSSPRRRSPNRQKPPQLPEAPPLFIIPDKHNSASMHWY